MSYPKVAIYIAWVENASILTPNGISLTLISVTLTEVRHKMKE